MPAHSPLWYVDAELGSAYTMEDQVEKLKTKQESRWKETNDESSQACALTWLRTSQ